MARNLWTHVFTFSGRCLGVEGPSFFLLTSQEILSCGQRNVSIEHQVFVHLSCSWHTQSLGWKKEVCRLTFLIPLELGAILPVSHPVATAWAFLLSFIPSVLLLLLLALCVQCVCRGQRTIVWSWFLLPPLHEFWLIQVPYFTETSQWPFLFNLTIRKGTQSLEWLCHNLHLSSLDAVSIRLAYQSWIVIRNERNLDLAAFHTPSNTLETVAFLLAKGICTR